MTGPDQFGMAMQKYGGLYFSRMHITEQRGLYTRPFACGVPVLHGWEKRHSMSLRGGFLDDISQDVIPTVSVDHDQRLDARSAQGGGDVADHGVQGRRGDAHRARPGRVLVRAGDGHRRQQVHRVRGGYLPGYGTGHERVGGQRQIRAVLLETADRKHGHLPAGARAARPYVRGGVGGKQPGHRRLRPASLGLRIGPRSRTAHLFTAFRLC
ncbi:hypothetical protein STRIP9103_08367 [Streptomyces ipomoeae 91-03]|uniref:Uncharacterized protein n=1 Tax=Streptomyces ipomoeae 91-03 TaxID=698759 RepID=L1KVG9_9ACTN|nr:hypothetical protein STRIP9103_08367 [Streptomyces ipomoeae 91-03]